MLLPGRAHAPPGAPPGPPGPQLLHAARFLSAESRFLAGSRRRYGDIFTMKIWPFERLVAVADPAEVKRIFTGDANQLHAGEGNAILEPLVGLSSVLLLDETAHLHQRKLMLPPFHGERMRVYGQLMRDVCEREMASWPVGEPFRMHRSTQAITLKVILRAVFGMEEGARMDDLERTLAGLVDQGQRLMMFPRLQHDWGRHSPWARFLRARSETDALIFDEIRRRRADPALDKRADVLSLLLQATDEDGRPMSDVELRDQLVTLLVAGHETTATAMAWVFERVLRHPPVLARLEAELATGEEGYLENVIKETLRVRPVLHWAMRRLTAPMQVGPYTVPAGWTLGAATDLIHLRPDIYPDPHAFRPERFERNPTETYSWIPFGGGIRRCLGAAFALYEMKEVLGTIFTRCDLSVPSQKPERMARRLITFVPGRGARVVLRKPVAPA